ncbi:hypothetical protein UlMin_014988 [Ulmus minor]
MELTDSTHDELGYPRPNEPTRSGLGIDLNEIPSPAETLPDSIDVVRYYHDNPSPPPGGPATVPGAVGGSSCAACRLPELHGHMVVCDGCERGFHLACAGMVVPPASNSVEWVCGDCVCSGVKSRRWPLGVKSKQILDINASPPSDGDGDAEGAEEVLDTRKHTTADSYFGGNPFGASVACSNILYPGNGFGFQKASGIVAHPIKLGFEDILNHTNTISRRLEEVDLSFPLGRCRSSNNTAFRLSSRDPSEVFLQALRDFISARHGQLEEGWHVEFKQSMGSCDLYAVYCAPNGKTFDSVYEVACYLGLMSKYNLKDPDIRNEGSFSITERSHLPRKRKGTKFAVTNGFSENKEISIGDYGDIQSNGLRMEACGNTFDDNGKLTRAGAGKNCCSEYEQNNEGLPLQFEDFFLLCGGKVDMRPSYHNTNLIWPIGFKSCWHDKITGSLFISEVLDGGDRGPVFKVTRCGCSSVPIPNGSTVLFRSCVGQFSSPSDEEIDVMTWDNDCNIQMILSDPCPSLENDILSCFRCSNVATDVSDIKKLQLESCSIVNKSEIVVSGGTSLIDEIGEISVEETSSFLAWRKISEKIVSTCSDILKQKGKLNFFCEHVGNGLGFPELVTRNENSEGNYSSLDKFSSSPSSCGIPSVIHAGKGLDILYDVLAKWLDQDRFGLDVDFAQEILEQLPGVQSCSRYQMLSDRSHYSSSITVGNGLLTLKMRGGVESKEKGTLEGLYRRSKKAKLAEDQVVYDHCPLGKQLCSRVPLELVGDVYQVWELLWRFCEILGLKEPLLLEELEEELMNPWFDNSELLEKFEKEIRGSQTLSSSCKSGSVVSGENPHSFIQIETEAMKEAAQTKLASVTYGRCSGVALTKAHNSLLRVLISELQSKVAVLVDPSFDSGESKSRRGRKKDVDSLIYVKRNKLNMLPINELTWPELARRYILAVLSMDGILDSAEITSRESGKVFRCLQGDGGVLCGSLTGVAGMEADALLLAEATKQIFGSLERETDVFTLEDEGSEPISAPEKNSGNDGNIPEWAQVLEPVKKLPTNVGTRIRKCVYEALDRDPPEWAKKILQHSISKEVYKGNASGPTKKAVLSVLADVCGEGHPQKPDKRKKRKTTICISDVVMKQCRIVLRRAAAADDAKVFCNLLGRKLISSCDNDDEGLLGSPAMVSRPLDFRTIDLRLAALAYGGSHEAFLEDVRELWSNVRNAFGDQPDLVELAETLAQNFESLYEKEVVSLVHKFAEFAKQECLNGEKRKEIDDLLSSTSVIPKAPWDEGVCKVCGIDRDDDSVLLCDTCDAEYHTYCLNPPLARIPEGNWYCPSCIASKRMARDAAENIQVIIRRSGKKYQGEVTRVYLEALAQLAAKMEEKEYWEFTVAERTLLLKFLCDELLNSAIIRQHLEQCAEASVDLQHKLRAFSVEWKNLKSREEVLVAKASKIDPNIMNSLGEVGGLDRCSSLTSSEFKSQNPLDVGGRLKDAHAVVGGCNEAGNLVTLADSQKNDKSQSNELPASSTLPHEVDGSCRESCSPGKLQECKGKDNSSLQPVDQHGHFPPSDARSIDVTVNESQSYQSELNSIKNDISILKESINFIESELLKVSVRREFLGSDSLGRLYWSSVTPSRRPCIIVDGSASSQNGGKMNDFRGPARKTSTLQSYVPSLRGGHLPVEGSKDYYPFLSEAGNTVDIHSAWVSYQTDAEIDELIGYLKNNDPKERELKESLMHWQKMKFQEFQGDRSLGQDKLRALSLAASGEKAEISNCLVTRAAHLLEKRYGPCLELEIPDISKKRGKKARLTNDDKMYRCECLEPIWPGRHHCLSCHKTFLSDTELEVHNEGKCSSAQLAHEKGKEISDSSKVKGSRKYGTNRDECIGEIGRVEIPKAGFSELGAKLIKFQDAGVACPFDFEEICSKFSTKDSCKDLVQEIGLIGSKGVPSFVTSMSPCLGDATMELISKKDTGVESDRSEAAKGPVSFGGVNVTVGGHDSLSDKSPNRSAPNEFSELLKSQRPALGQREGRRSSGGHSSVMGVGRCCVVPQSSLRPFVGKITHISRRLKINLLDMDAALPEEAFRPSKASSDRRWAWRAFVKSAKTIYEMVQATFVLEDMIKTDYLRNEWWYWSSFSAAAKTSTISSLSLRIYSLDAAIVYEKTSSNSEPTDNMEPSNISDSKQPVSDPTEKTKPNRRSNKKRKEPES